MLDLSSPTTTTPEGTELHGVMTRVIFPRDWETRPEGTSYIIAEVRTPQGFKSVKGCCVAPQLGASYRFVGEWAPSRNGYAPAFAFTSYEVELPTEPPAIVQYLMGAAKWIGPTVGEAIVQAYGPETLHVLKTEPERVAAEINGVTIDRALDIQRMLQANELLEAATVGLTSLFHDTGLGRSAITKALAKWQHEALVVVQDNPFALLELDGVGFLTADRVRVNLGTPIDDPARIRAGIMHVLDTAAGGDGHTYLPDSIFRKKAMELLRVPAAAIEEQIEALGEVVVRTESNFLGLAGYDLSIARLARAEHNIAEQLRAMVQLGPWEGEEDRELDVDGLADDQIEALTKMQTARVFVLRGAPGTGKTYSVRRILASLPPSARVALAAPTGKAAKRLSEQTDQVATTIHRLLEPLPMNGRFVFTRNAENPLDVDVVVLDECSMIDVSLMASFIAALPLRARLILIGDTNQLPPVGPGNVFRDIISSGIVDVAELRTIKRQDAGFIIRNCHSLRDGRNITIDNEASADFFWDEHEDAEAIVQAVVDLVARRLPSYGRGYNPMREIQVITPIREKNETSCKELNKRLQAALNPNRPGENMRFAVGDKVIQTKNDYELGVFNGDIGFLDAIDTRARTYTVTFESPTRTVAIQWSKAELELAYAITCHKFQGSEAPAVVVPIHRSQSSLVLQRSWLYTAISRAREVCVCVGQSGEVQKIVKRQAQARRFTRLEGLLRGEGSF